MAFAKITSKGQITIPKAVRDSLKLKPGDRVDIRINEEQQAILIPKNRSYKDFKGIFKDPKRTKPVSLKQMEQNLSDYFRKKYSR